jgi:hypothetical protein
MTGGPDKEPLFYTQGRVPRQCMTRNAGICTAFCSKMGLAVQQRGITTIDLTDGAVKNLESVTCTNTT